ncbi:hypothetical protein B0H16DRAFT_1708957 [Mycena metata]|uniref:Uncharacterized protein n=1 Tax=Mycena metata TaxID=1033252 RepID=A0AAD7KF41_9AGAR|nr:hypothetical protein B0H16DRAFT_1708957 [Mycena metata]
MSKLEFPKLSDKLTPASVNGWIGRCEDTYNAWQGMKPDRSVDTKLLITLAGLRLEELSAVIWWNENCDTLKKLLTFKEFSDKLRERFVHANWKLVALGDFYAVCQGSMSFKKFAKMLELARNSLSSAGTAYTINDSILKNHLLFHAHPILRLCVIGQPGFNYTNLKVDGLVVTMAMAWDSLVAERVVRESSEQLYVSIPSSTLTTSLMLSPATLPTPPPSATPRSFSHSLTSAEKDALRAAGGCYHCKKTPASPGLTRHCSDNCPSDVALGIPPSSSVVAAVGPVGFSSLYDEVRAVAAVFPAIEDENDSSISTGTDNSDLSTRDY